MATECVQNDGHSSRQMSSKNSERNNTAGFFATYMIYIWWTEMTEWKRRPRSWDLFDS